MDILQTLNEIVKEYNGTDIKLEPSATFDELGFDSLDKVELIMAVEEKFHITFSDDADVKTVGELIALIQNLAS